MQKTHISAHRSHSVKSIFSSGNHLAYQPAETGEFLWNNGAASARQLGRKFFKGTDYKLLKTNSNGRQHKG